MRETSGEDRRQEIERLININKISERLIKINKIDKIDKVDSEKIPRRNR